MKALRLRLKLILYAKVLHYANENGLTVTETIRYILNDFFKRNEPK